MGVSNLAARRGAKASRRKAIVAQKRKAEALEGTAGGQALRAAGLPIRCCMLTKNLFQGGMGTLVLARGSTFGQVVIGAFLLDTFCRGVKDILVRTIDGEQLEYYLDRLNEASPLMPVDPSYARKLLQDLVRWSSSLGFQPPRDFTTVERLFGTVDPQTCETAFTFGQGDKPFYMSGPSEPPSLARRHVERMSEQLGEDGFHYFVPL
jgi:hypothetical protein